MNKHLFLGDSTYPHLAKSTNENICGQLRELAPDLVEHHTKQIVFAVDRIEQLERDLDKAISAMQTISRLHNNEMSTNEMCGNAYDMSCIAKMCLSGLVIKEGKA